MTRGAHEICRQSELFLRLGAYYTIQNLGAATQPMARVSVIIPAYGACPHLLECLRALLAGERPPDQLIVAHSGADDPTVAIAALSAEVVVLHSEQRLLAGAARNRGAQVADGEWLAFIDADVRPCPGWLAALVIRAEGPTRRLVVGSVGTATPGGYWGMVNWLCEFSEQAPWHPVRQQVGGASCSMLVRADDFRRAGGFAEAFQPAEDTLLFARLRQDGCEHWFEPRARVDHHNATGFAAFRRHQDQLGRHSALIRRRIELPGSIATRLWPLACLLWLPRGLLGLRRLLQGGPRWWLRAPYYGPGMALGALIWNRGFLAEVVSPSLAREPPSST